MRDEQEQGESRKEKKRKEKKRKEKKRKVGGRDQTLSYSILFILWCGYKYNYNYSMVVESDEWMEGSAG